MKTTRACRIATAVAVLVTAVVAVGAASPTPAAAGDANAEFDYSMPDRYGLDHDGDGAIDSYVPTITCDADGDCTNRPATSAFPVQQETWHVDFDACASSDGAVEFEWQVLSRPEVIVQQAASGRCSDYFAEFPSEGTYRVRLRVKTSLVGLWGPWTEHDVVVQDWLVVSMGDSYGAGEGTPDVEIDPDTLPDVAAALADLGDALEDLVDFGPCNAGTGFDFDACVTALDDAGHDAIDYAASKIQQLDDRVCDPINHFWDGFNAVACVQLLIDLAVSVADDTADAIGAAAQDTYDDYVERFQDAYDAAAELVDTLQTAIENFDRGATWQDRRCHRSANASASLAAMELERRDPHTSVTLVHVACTGAMILQGLIDTYAGAEDERESTMAPPIPPQVHQVSQLIGDREIDVVQLSIGGNDVNFGPMIFSCLLRVDCTQPNQVDDPEVLADAAAAELCPDFVSMGVSFALRPILADRCPAMFDTFAVDPLLAFDAQTLFDRGRNGDPADPLRPGWRVAYDLLGQALHRAPYAGSGIPDEPDEPGLGLPADRDDRVYITEYVNPLRHETGRVCSFEVDGFDTVPGVSGAEATWLQDVIVPALTEVVQGAAAQEGWNFITGVVSGFESRYGHGHGYCADPDVMVPTAYGPPADARFMVRIQDAFLRQGNKMGGVHPSRSGYRQYAEQILPAWLGDLYTNPSTLAGPRRPDQAPYADAGPNRLLDEGASVPLTTESYDGDGDSPLSYFWSTASSAFSVAPAGSPTPTLSAIDDGSGFLELSVDDGDEGPSADRAAVQVRNVAPTVTGFSASAVEGSALSASVTYTDPGTVDTHTATVDYGDGTGPVAATVSGRTVSLSHTYPDEGSFSIGVTVTDDDLGIGTGAVAVTVANAPPVVGTVTAPIAPVLIGTGITVSAPFTDAGALDTHTASVDWGDATSSAAAVTETAGSGSVAASHTYTATGIYTVAVNVADGDGGVGSAQFLYVVVYDPAGGFATGGGTIDSPAGAYRPNPDISGMAIFAFVSKYQRGATVPQGNTSFRFNAADFVFASTSYQWLVVSGSRATYKGWGTVNGNGEYGFLLAAIDGDRDGSPGPDRLRLKVWDVATGAIVYDNQLGAGDDAAPVTAIRAGAISVSGAKK